MDPSGQFNENDPTTNFQVVQLQKQSNEHSYSVIGIINDIDFRILAVLEKPIPYALMVEFTRNIAKEFKATFQER